MSIPRIRLGFPSDIPPELVTELEIIASRHAFGLPAPNVVVMPYVANGVPKTLIWCADPADQPRVLAELRTASAEGVR